MGRARHVHARHAGRGLLATPTPINSSFVFVFLQHYITFCLFNKKKTKYNNLNGLVNLLIVNFFYNDNNKKIIIVQGRLASLILLGLKPHCASIFFILCFCFIRKFVLHPPQIHRTRDVLSKHHISLAYFILFFNFLLI